MNTKVYCVIVVAAIVYSAGSVLGGVVKRSDDTNLQALQTLVQQQSATIQQQSATIQQQASAIQILQADMTVIKASSTNMNNALTKLTKAVAFTVHFSADDPDHGIDLGDNPILRFDAVTTNIGGGYDNHFGMFTAPVPGTYAFFLTEMAPNQTPAIILDITKEDQVLDTVFAPGSQDIDDQGASSLVTTHLNAGDRVWVKRHSEGHAIRGGFNTIFTGYLLHPDL